MITLLSRSTNLALTVMRSGSFLHLRRTTVAVAYAFFDTSAIHVPGRSLVVVCRGDLACNLVGAGASRRRSGESGSRAKGVDVAGLFGAELLDLGTEAVDGLGVGVDALLEFAVLDAGPRCRRSSE
jgi:hypothetical protein